MKPLTSIESRATICLALGNSLVECAWALNVCRARMESLKWRAISKLRRGAKVNL